MGQIHKGLEPSELWQHFAALNRTPRCSDREAAALVLLQSLLAVIILKTGS